MSDSPDMEPTVTSSPNTLSSIEKEAVSALVMLCDYDTRSIGDEENEGENKEYATDMENEGEDEDEYGSDDGDDSESQRVSTEMDYDDDGINDYFAMRLSDTLAGWTYSRHPKSICLTPPDAWDYTPHAINVQWYKRPIFYSQVHKGYFLSNAERFVSKVEELGAVHNQERVW